MAFNLQAREPEYPIAPRDISQVAPEAVKALTTGEFRAHQPGDIGAGSPTAKAAVSYNKWYPVLGTEVLSWSSRNGALVQREAEAEPLILPMGRNVYAVPRDRIGIVFALNRKNECAGAVIARGMARRAAKKQGLASSDVVAGPRARWMVRTRMSGDSMLEQPVSVRSGDFVVLAPGQELYLLDEDRKCADMSVIWTEHQLYADPASKEESDENQTETELTEGEVSEEKLPEKE
ncbi:unnamed protein product [Clonostachys rhizophaga]|uniref:Uncharacterized protein n=1 Tax=Clonostachys rhizophaga TaxID=160324 RepID=A0A9N9YM95_9HYPO|nr:unnamed protein product [Clonostachys rhizophaga]